MFKIAEIYDSIISEGYWQGYPATHIRFSGCELRCSWCDSKFAWEDGRMMDIDSVLRAVDRYYVVLTGGEPALQDLPLLRDLASKLRESYLIVETAGHLSGIDLIDFDWVAVSPKKQNGYRISVRRINEIRVVVDEDLDLAALEEIDSRYRNVYKFLQPEGDRQEMSEKALRLQAKLNSSWALRLRLSRIIHVR